MEEKKKLWMNFLSPPVLVVAITGILAPFVSSSINADIHKKDIQKDILQTIIKATEKDDFSKIETLEKLQVIASVIEENSDDFGLNLDATLAILDNKVVAGTSKLKSEVDLLTADIGQLQSQQIEDSLLLIKQEELQQLKPEDIDSDRMVINIKGAKGEKDRTTLLSLKALTMLRT